MILDKHPDMLDAKIYSGTTPLLAAARNNGKLFQTKKKLNVKIVYESILFDYFVWYSIADIDGENLVKYLISKGADVNVKEYDGTTMLHVTGKSAKILRANGN